MVGGDVEPGLEDGVGHVGGRPVDRVHLSTQDVGGGVDEKAGEAVAGRTPDDVG